MRNVGTQASSIPLMQKKIYAYIYMSIFLHIYEHMTYINKYIYIGPLLSPYLSHPTTTNHKIAK